VGFDQLPFDGIGEQLADVLDGKGFVRQIQRQIFPVADARHPLDRQEVSQPKDAFRLALGIGMQGVGADFRAIFQQTVEDVHRFPNPAGDKTAEQRDIRVGHVI
jgi:hypothetical protein